MKRTFVLSLVLAAIMAFVSTANLYGFEEKEVDFGFGKVVNILPNLITLKETVYAETDEEAEEQISYIINTETVFENVDSLSEISVDDEIEIIFVEEEGQKIAVRIHKFDVYQWDIDEENRAQLDEVQEEIAYELERLEDK